MFSVCLFARQPGGAVKGTVKTDAGVAIAHARVIAKGSNGQVVTFVLTDDQGRFRFPPLQPGVYSVEVESAGSWNIGAKTVEVRDGETVELNFIGRPSHAGQAGKPDLLGPVTFYNNSDFKQGKLENPSGGGGYSNGASAQASQMLKQYLAPRESSTSAPGTGANRKLGVAIDAREAEFERTGSKLLAEKDYTQAIQVFEKATALYPRSERLQMGLGLSLYGAGKYKAAVVALGDAARLAPDDPAPIVMLSEASQFTPDPAATGLLKRFSELHPKSAEGHYAYGLSLWRDFRSHHSSETLASAQAEFEKAVALDPNDAAAHLQLGMIYDEQKAMDRATGEYLAATRANPNLAAAHYRLAQEYERLGEKDKAAAELALYEKLRGRASP
ncbi:MAG: carboxypeptidase regulatory-like domain-containing protein [Acidobacteriota bacterium]